jgi:hypothetical protein
MARSADQLHEQLYFLQPVAEIATQFLIGAVRGICTAQCRVAGQEVHS